MSPASIVITNFNQGRFVGQAIQSAIAQTHPAVEVVVVDDGSSDDSRSVIGAFGDSIRTVYKDNGGQASAINAGVEVAGGDFLYFLDADDAYAPGVVASSIGLLEGGAVKVHWPVQPIDEAGRNLGRPSPAGNLASGDQRGKVLRLGPATHTYPPSSANAAARSFLTSVLPVPEHIFRTGADMYISELAAFAGPIAVATDALTFYRRHDANDSDTLSGEQRIARWAGWYDACVAAADAYCRRRGIDVDTADWIGHGWPSRLSKAVRAMNRLIPAGECFVVVDDDVWGLSGDLPGAQPFGARNDVYSGPPADDDAAIATLDRSRSEGVNHVAVLWNAFWWLDHYSRAFTWLEKQSVRRDVDGVLALYSFR